MVPIKVFISADIEGIAGITHWDEADRQHPDYAEFRALMTAEAVAACESATAAGATEILIKDAHSSGRNLILSDLPENVRIVRGWSGHPFTMYQELDDSFDAVVLTGYHAKGGADGNPLGHTMSGRTIHCVSINGAVASEFTFGAIVAAVQKVPICFVSGDAGICADVREANGNIARSQPARGAAHRQLRLLPPVRCD